MTQNPDPDKLKDLEQRLQKARGGKNQSQEKDRKRKNSFGQAYKIGLEMVVAIAVGGFVGWALDRWLETAPWLMIIFFFLGVAAGFTNVYKAAEKMRSDSSD